MNTIWIDLNKDSAIKMKITDAALIKMMGVRVYEYEEYKKGHASMKKAGQITQKVLDGLRS